MAAPVKAYINPTSGALKWVGDSGAVPQAAPPPTPFRAAAQRIATTAVSAIRIPLRGLTKAPVSPSTTQFDTPPPPMGTLKLVTFPAIYTSGRRTRPSTGQLWPRTR